MKLVNLALVSLVVAGGLVAAGCASKSDGSGEGNSLGTSESLLVADNEEVDEQEETTETGIEEPLSGADPTDPGAPAEGTNDADLASKLKTNPGKWFKPAGCIVSTVSGNVATHVFTNCTGPYGFVNFNGTVTTTYVRGNGSLTITYEANGFKANGAAISGKRVVVFTKNGSVVTKRRTGAWTGTTKKGKEISHDADFTVTWDSATKCVTRSGSAQTSVGGREFSRTITGYKRCGIGSGGCPESGTIALSRTKGDNTASLTIELLGGRDYTVTGPKGRSATLQLVCREN